MKVTFVTGGTGLIGGEMIPRLLNNDGDGIVRVLIRAHSDAEASARLDGTLRYLFKEADLPRARRRVTALRGDVTRERLGLTEGAFADLAAEATHIVHAAATTRFDLTLAEATAVNLGGTRRVLELARRAARARLDRLVYVSTAYVSGDRCGRILEEDLAAGQRFMNSYEETKFEAEREVRANMEEVPALVIRPCAIIGDSGSGRTRTFNVIYYPLKLLSRGLLRALPGSPSTPIDLVPVDYVADAANHLMLRSDLSGRTFHLTAGDRVESIGAIARLAVKHLNETRGNGGRRLPSVRFVPQLIFHGLLKPALKLLSGSRGRQVIAKLEIYLPYLTTQKVFDTSNAMRELRGTGIAVPRLADYFGRVVRYCLETDWGRAESAPGRGDSGKPLDAGARGSA
jgi:long-chain acyl-CoA synthetase